MRPIFNYLWIRLTETPRADGLAPEAYDASIFDMSRAVERSPQGEALTNAKLSGRPIVVRAGGLVGPIGTDPYGFAFVDVKDVLGIR